MADVLLGTVIQNLGSFIRQELSTFLGVEELTESYVEISLQFRLSSKMLKRSK